MFFFYHDRLVGLLFSLLALNFVAASIYDCVGAMHRGASPEFQESLQAAPLAPRFFGVLVGVSVSKGRTFDGRDWRDVRGRHVYDVKKNVNDAFVGVERPCKTAVHERGHQVFVLLAFTPGWEELYSRIDNADAKDLFSEDGYCRESSEYFACASQVWCGVYPKKAGVLPRKLVSVMKTVYGDGCRMPSVSSSDSK